MKLFKLLSAFVVAALSFSVDAQTNTTVTVASGPGGNIERYGRVFQKHLPAWLGNPVVFEFKPGGGGQIALQHLARSTANGPHFMVSLMSYDPTIDQTHSIVPILSLGELGIVAYTHADGPKNLAEIINNKSRVFATAQQNVPNAMLDGFVEKMDGRLNKILYASAAKQITDVLGRHLDMGFTSPPNIKPHIEAGTIRSLWVFNSSRLPSIPDTPTIRELGVRWPQEDMQNHFMLWASTGTSQAAIAKVQQEFRHWITSSEGAETLKSMDILSPQDAVITKPDLLIKRLVQSK